MPQAAYANRVGIHAVDAGATPHQALSRMNSLAANWLAVARDGVVLGTVEKKDLLNLKKPAASLGQLLADRSDIQSPGLCWIQ